MTNDEYEDAPISLRSLASRSRTTALLFGARGDRLSGMLALALVVLGVWVAASPASVPGLTEPTGSPSMQMSP